MCGGGGGGGEDWTNGSGSIRHKQIPLAHYKTENNFMEDQVTIKLLATVSVLE